MTQLLRHHEDELGQGLTYDLWKNFPVDEILVLKDRNVGYGVMLDPTSFDAAVDADAATVLYCTGGARGYIDQNSTIRQLTMAQGGVGGGIRIFATADNEEAWLQWCGATGSPFRISDNGAEARDLVFEVAFRIPNITVNKYGFFIGLGEEGLAAADTIADAGTLASKDLVGFFKPEGNTDELDIVYSLAGQAMVTHVDGWQKLKADTWYHVGFRYNGQTKSVTPWFGTGDRKPETKMAAYAENKILPSDIASAGADKFPDGAGLAPLIGLKNAHADDAYVDVRLMACAQVF